MDDIIVRRKRKQIDTRSIKSEAPEQKMPSRDMNFPRELPRAGDSAVSNAAGDSKQVELQPLSEPKQDEVKEQEDYKQKDVSRIIQDVRAAAAHSKDEDFPSNSPSLEASYDGAREGKMKMKRGRGKKIASIFVIFVLSVVLVSLLIFGNGKEGGIVSFMIDRDGESLALLEKKDMSLISFSDTAEYMNEKYGFSFMYPVEMTIKSYTELIGEGGGAREVILLQRKDKSTGVQILITPFAKKELDITEGYIRSNIPDLEIEDPQVIQIGAKRSGLAFITVNKAFGGKSREVWFVYKGNFYQISTYTELDTLLREIFGSWKFM